MTNLRMAVLIPLLLSLALHMKASGVAIEQMTKTSVPRGPAVSTLRIHFIEQPASELKSKFLQRHQHTSRRAYRLLNQERE